MTNTEIRTQFIAYKALAEKLLDENDKLTQVLYQYTRGTRGRHKLIYRGSSRWCESQLGAISYAYEGCTVEYLIEEGICGFDYIYAQSKDYACVKTMETKNVDK